MSRISLTIGVLALQGDFAEHLNTIKQLGYTALAVRNLADAKMTDGLIIPGGESTTIGKLLRSTKLDAWIKHQASKGYPIYGTCAGCILIAKQVDSPYSLKLIDITVKRNAYGRQRDSFETTLQFKHDGALEQLRGIFIRAPQITRVNKNVETLITHHTQPALVRDNNILAGTFHPELADTLIIHRYFVQMVKQATIRN